MPRPEQSPRWELKDYRAYRIFHGYTEFGLKMVESGFIARILHLDWRNEEIPLWKQEVLEHKIYSPFTKDLEHDIKHSVLSDEVVENLLFNSHRVKEERKLREQ